MDAKIFVSGLLSSKEWRKELVGFTTRAKKELGSKSCDLAVFFVSEAYEDFDPELFLGTLSERLGCRVILGCNSSGVIGNDTEIEMTPGISILAMHLPGVRLYPFYVSSDDASSIKSGNELINFLDIFPTDNPQFICLADPMSCDITKLLGNFNEAYKGAPVIGGLASGGVIGISNWLAMNNNIYSDGAVGLAFFGNIHFDILVSQGCRPIDKPLVITKADNNILLELGGKPALVALRDILESLSGKDRVLAEQSLFVGVVMNERKEDFKRGDFLIRNIMGFDPETGALMIGAVLKAGQTIQFQLRDAETSSEDLEALLKKLSTPNGAYPKGALLVSCCGRGINLYGAPHHDVKIIQSHKGPLPLTGFFANGEIGPVGSKNYVHGYTSSLVILS